MRRALVTVGVAVLVSIAGASGALAFSGGGGKSEDAPGQARAQEQCFSAFLRQYESGVAARGGPKNAFDSGETPGIGPLNCDHYWQAVGAIGNG